MLNKLPTYLRTVYKLGLKNVFYVMWYRSITKVLFRKIYFPQKIQKVSGPIFLPSSSLKTISDKQKSNIIESANLILEGNFKYYAYHNIHVGKKPNWFLNPFNGYTFKNNFMHWSKIADFDDKIGDIKNIWEMSRFNWIGTLVQAYAITSDNKYLRRLNEWLIDWLENNPPNTGPNWKCGQEASIRVMNLILGQEILKSNKVTDEMNDFLEIHIDRILPTTFYAKAQNNNHGLSEGCALFLGGYFLWKNKKEKKYYFAYQKGSKLIEDQIQNLVLNDGTFAQYSIVYHRMILDLLSVLELFRREWGIQPFSESFYEKVNSAVEWFSEMIDLSTGKAPNMGGNDGTYLFNYDNKDYRDFRPSLVLVSSIFNIPIDDIIQIDHTLVNIFSLPYDFVKSGKKISKKYPEGGYVRLERDGGRAIIRIPQFNFRPQHSDALHIDIWQNGINWIRDAGSFSYALNNQELDVFSGTQGHSTVQFDNRNQMPRISRFLYGDWLKPSYLKFSYADNSVSSDYIDGEKAYHSRKICEIKNGWQVVDNISGVFNSAVVRWILRPGIWKANGYLIQCGNTSIKTSSDKIHAFKLISGKESLVYMKHTPVPILYIKFVEESTIRTDILFSK